MSSENLWWRVNQPEMGYRFNEVDDYFWEGESKKRMRLKIKCIRDRTPSGNGPIPVPGPDRRLFVRHARTSVHVIQDDFQCLNCSTDSIIPAQGSPELMQEQRELHDYYGWKVKRPLAENLLNSAR
ncbi:hypothetical protein CIHG_06271 [Coccidioides immitis H538.4]|uniref:Uncharacterized protein n=1 Tax=Coccidioides immitis H538.4 TaxID=396776 RepID=A0A0J8RTC6_COCIT|nr:hypothetical protein CIHG_06271 [Coccidioides immitis H538.4]